MKRTSPELLADFLAQLPPAYQPILAAIRAQFPQHSDPELAAIILRFGLTIFALGRPCNRPELADELLYRASDLAVTQDRLADIVAQAELSVREARILLDVIRRLHPPMPDAAPSPTS